MPKKTGKKSSILTRKQKIAAADLSEYGDAGGDANSKPEYLENPTKSDADLTEYRVIKLSNGIIVTLMSSPQNPTGYMKDTKAADDEGDPNPGGEPPKSDKGKETVGSHWAHEMMKIVDEVSMRAYCSLSINVGWFSDPPHLPQTLSSVLRSAILISSQKYSQENSFYAFLKNNDGTFYISPENGELTYFSFTSPLPEFCEALDRFSNCFANPRLRRASIMKFRNALDARHDYDFMTDTYLSQRSRLFTSLISNNPRHPAKSIGNQDARNLYYRLGDELCEKVEAFMKRHYSAHRMKVVLQAQLPLDKLEEYARKYFSRLPSNGLPSIDLSSYSYDQCFNIPEFNMIYELKPQLDADKDTIDFYWSMPPLQKHYRTKPVQYITSMFRNPFSGSLGDYLLKNDWSVTMEVPTGVTDLETNSVYYLFSVTIQLTQEGKKNLKKVLDAVYSFINFMKMKGTEKQVYDEVRHIAEARFRVDADNLVDNACKDLRKTMHLYPSIDYLTADSIYYDYDPEAIKTCLDCMSPEKTLIIMHGRDMIGQCFSEDLDSDSEDEEGGTFKRMKIPKKWINDWKKIEPLPCFKVPKPNIFCPTDFSLVPAPKKKSKVPVKIHSDSVYEVWHKYFDAYPCPDCGACIHYITDVPLQSVENAAMLDLLLKCLPRLFAEDLHPASLAGMKYAVQTYEGEFTIKLVGTRQNLPLLMLKIGESIANCSSLMSEELLCDAKDEIFAYYCATADSTEVVARDIQTSFLKDIYWTLPEKLAAHANITLEKFKYFVQHFTDHGYVRSFVYGNVEASHALDMVRHFVAVMKCGPRKAKTTLIQGSKEIPRGFQCCRVQRLNPSRSYHCIINHYQVGKNSPTTAAALELLWLIGNNPIFSPLQTRRNMQFSDITLVLPGDQSDSILLGYFIIARNFDAVPDFTGDNIRIETYRSSYKNMLEKLSILEWEVIKSIFVQMKKDSSSMSHDFIDPRQATCSHFASDRDIQRAEAIAQLPIPDLQKLIIGMINTDSNTRKLSVQVIGHTESESKQPELKATLKDFQWKIVTDTTANKDYIPITDISAYKRTLKTISQFEQ